MFGFHKRQRSLISIKGLEKEDQLEQLHRREDEADLHGSDDEETVSADTHRQTRNLTMIYLLFLAEAIMASSLSAQVAILAPTATGCFDTDASFLRSISECAYFTGSPLAYSGAGPQIEWEGEGSLFSGLWEWRCAACLWVLQEGL